jgi:hypothetical protein
LLNVSRRSSRILSNLKKLFKLVVFLAVVATGMEEEKAAPLTWSPSDVSLKRSPSDVSLRKVPSSNFLSKLDSKAMSSEEIGWSKKVFLLKLVYDYNKSTEENYASDDAPFVGKFKKVRNELDYTYHRKYSVERQLFQDALIENFLETIVKDKDNANVTCDHPTENWIVFTAGPMGAGKGRTITWLGQEGLFPTNAFVTVDPDIIRSMLPEMEGYNEIDPLNMGWLTQKEVGYISELLTYRALDAQKNVLVDGSLRDKHWYHSYFCNLRKRFPILKIAIIHVTAQPETVLERARKRAQITGRKVPPQAILDSMKEIPKSLEVLSPVTDLLVNFENENSSPPEPLLLDLTMRGFDRDPGGEVNKSRVLWTMKLAKTAAVDDVYQESMVSVGGREGEWGEDQKYYMDSEDTFEAGTYDSETYSVSMTKPPTFLLHDFALNVTMPLSDWRSEFSIIWEQKCAMPIFERHRKMSIRASMSTIMQRTPFTRGFSMSINESGDWTPSSSIASDHSISDSPFKAVDSPVSTTPESEGKKLSKKGSLKSPKGVYPMLGTLKDSKEGAEMFGSVDSIDDFDEKVASAPTPKAASSSPPPSPSAASSNGNRVKPTPPPPSPNRVKPTPPPSPSSRSSRSSRSSLSSSPSNTPPNPPSLSTTTTTTGTKEQKKKKNTAEKCSVS